MKYSDPEWGKLIRQELKSRNMSQVQLAKKLGKSSAAVRMLLTRDTYRLPNIQAISRAFGKDLVEELLSEDTRALLAKARLSGFHPGQEVIQDRIDMAVAKVEQEKQLTEDGRKVLEDQLKEIQGQLSTAQSQGDELEVRLGAQEDQLRNLDQDREQSVLDLKAASEKIEEKRVALEEIKDLYASALAEKEKEIHQLKEEKRDEEYESKLKIAVLEAKLEILQAGTKG